MDKYQETIATYNKFAERYEEKFMDFELYQGTYDLFCSYVDKEQARILEVGCGPGNITRYVLNKRPDYRVFGIDLAEKMIDLARKNNPEAEFEIMDCRDIGKLQGGYDALLAGFCLPYISKEDAVKFIRDASDLLVSGGILHLSTMEGDYSTSGFKGPSTGEADRAYIHYHEMNYLEKALADNGFSIEEVKRQAYPETDGTTTTDLFIFARKKA